jgi:hypothetical protein
VDICAVRLGRLNPDGSPDDGSATGAVALCSGQSKLGWTAQYYTVAAIQDSDGCGNLVVNVPAEQLLAGYTVELDVLVQSDELHELGYGAQLITDGPAVIGHAVLLDTACGTPSVKSGVSIEAWAKNIVCGEPDVDFPFKRYVFSKAKLTPGDGSLAKGTNHLVLKGSTFKNSQLGAGPFGDLPAGTPAGFALATFLDIALPDCDSECGYVTTPAAS